MEECQERPSLIYKAWGLPLLKKYSLIWWGLDIEKINLFINKKVCYNKN